MSSNDFQRLVWLVKKVCRHKSNVRLSAYRLKQPITRISQIYCTTEEFVRVLSAGGFKPTKRDGFYRVDFRRNRWKQIKWPDLSEIRIEKKLIIILTFLLAL